MIHDSKRTSSFDLIKIKLILGSTGRLFFCSISGLWDLILIKVARGELTILNALPDGSWSAHDLFYDNGSSRS